MRRLAFLLLPLLLASCGDARKVAPAPAPEDAAVNDALADPIMTDPDLVSQNAASAAIAVVGPVSSALPPVDRTDAAIGAARDAAAQLLGGTIPAAPEPSPGDLAPFRAAVTAAQVAAAARVTRPACIEAVQYTARWAAELPAPLEIYPRGAVVEAAGTDASGCALRVVRFKTPAAPDDVLAFYYARLRAAGFPAAHSAEGADHLLLGRKGAIGYAIHVRQDDDGLTVTAIVVAGS